MDIKSIKGALYGSDKCNCLSINQNALCNDTGLYQDALCNDTGLYQDALWNDTVFFKTCIIPQIILADLSTNSFIFQSHIMTLYVMKSL